MSNDNEPATMAELKAANRALADSLRRCRDLVKSYRLALRPEREDRAAVKSEGSGR